MVGNLLLWRPIRGAVKCNFLKYNENFEYDFPHSYEIVKFFNVLCRAYSKQLQLC